MSEPISIAAGFEKTTFFGHRTPGASGEAFAAAFGALATYRDGAVYVANYAGNSEWERHPVGDEFVMVVEGATTITLLIDGKEKQNSLAAMEFVVVPQNVWHRFESPEPVKVLTITPQPTDHLIDHPNGEIS